MTASLDRNPHIIEPTLEQKIDFLVEELKQVRELVEWVPEMSNKMKELSDYQEEISEKLTNLGFDVPNFKVTRYDS